MSVLGVVAFVSKQPIEGNVMGGLPHGRFQKRHVVAGAARDNRAGKQIGRGMAHEGEFGPMPLDKRLRFTAPIEVMGTGVTRFKPRGVDSPFGPLVYEAEGVGPFEYRGEQGGQSPFFSSRFSA